MTATLADAVVARCECGCGEPAPIATRTDRRYGVRAGQPRRFIAGHNATQAGALAARVAKVCPPPATAPGAVTCRRCPYPLVPVNYAGEAPPGWRRHTGRGLCKPCRDDLAAEGRLDEFETATRRRDEVLDDWGVLRLRGMGRAEAADRMGISVDALLAHIRRGADDGDSRAVMGTP